LYGNREEKHLYLERIGSVFAVQIIHCTKKLMNELEVLPSGRMVPEPLSGFLGPWHANLIRIERRKCLLLTNDRTLYSFLVPGVKKKDLGTFRELFALDLKRNLEKEGFGPEDIAKALREYDEITIAPTANRSVLGSMNDLAYQADFLVSRAGGLGKGDMLTVNMMLNRIPMGAIKYDFAIEKLYTLFGRTDKIGLPINPFLDDDSIAAG
jgi:hypothetical protein